MGTYNVSINYITFLCSVLYLDIWSGILRYFYDYHTPEGQKKPINCGFAIFGISTLLYTVIIVAFGQFVQVQYLPLIYLYGLMMNLQNLLGYVARAYGKNVLYASAGLLNSFVTAVMNIVLIVGLHMDYSALYLAGCLGYLSNIILIGIGVRLWTLIRPSAFEKALFLRMFRFSLPLSGSIRPISSAYLPYGGKCRFSPSAPAAFPAPPPCRPPGRRFYRRRLRCACGAR